MVIGIIVWELEVIGAGSLKEKRSVVRSLKDRLRDRFNISVAETAYHDKWQRTELTACCVATDGRGAEAEIERADRLVAGEPRARLIDSYRSFR